MRSCVHRFLGVCALVTLGCGASAGGDHNSLSGGGESDTEDGTDGGPVGDGSPSDDEAGDTADEDAYKFDTPNAPDPEGSGQGCEKVDFLFVIDNSASMQRSQEELIGSFPGFIDAIRETVNGQDYHVMIVDTDSTGDCACGPWTELAQYCHEIELEGCTDHCAMCPYDGSNCDNVLGAGRTESSPETGMQDCGFSSDHRYLVDGEADLDGAFACAANVGTQGDWNERPLRATQYAVSEALTGAGGCNEGFVRDDAILVVTIVSDAGPNTSNMEHSRGSAEEWAAGVVGAKQGNQDAIVVVGFLGDSDLPDGACIQPDQMAPEYRKFVGLFGDRGFLGSTCDDSYPPLFEQAVATIDTACDEFEPEG